MTETENKQRGPAATIWHGLTAPVRWVAGAVDTAIDAVVSVGSWIGRGIGSLFGL